ncbi:MAG: efflux transporter periplasmic adaptor subunit, partial [Pseudomonas sp.]|nr:efflux transporter periplasmic adaptor subunit [Pseudomonas sp.]
MPMKPARVALLPLLVSTLLLSACQESEQAEQQQQQQQTPTVGVVTLKAEHFLLTNDLPGRTAAYRIAEVRPQVNGILEKRLFEEGAEVEEGQQLYQIDDDVYQAALKSAEASSISTRSLAERYGILVKENAVSQQEYDEARAAGLQAQAALDEARINVRYTKVLAPISGRIGRSAVSEGALVTSGQ